MYPSTTGVCYSISEGRCVANAGGRKMLVIRVCKGVGFTYIYLFWKRGGIVYEPGVL